MPTSSLLSLVTLNALPLSHLHIGLPYPFYVSLSNILILRILSELSVRAALRGMMPDLFVLGGKLIRVISVIQSQNGFPLQRGAAILRIMRISRLSSDGISVEEHFMATLDCSIGQLKDHHLQIIIFQKV